VAISIRALSHTNLESADSILQSAFSRSESWLNDLYLFLKLQPEGIFLACQDSIPAGMVAAIIYSHYAYVGLMGICPAFQRQGIGLALMKHLLAWLDQQGVQQILLDASPIGQPLYEKLGFKACEEVYIFQRPTGQPPSPRPIEAHFLSLQNLDLITALDRQAFGADRSRLLQALLSAYPERAFFSTDEQDRVSGYVIAQEKRIGPWVMEDPLKAEGLLKAALSLPFRGPISVVVPGENADAIALLRHYKFEIVRVNRHMIRGSAVSVGQREDICAQASLSLG